MATVNVVREAPAPPPVREVILTMTLQETEQLRAFLQQKDVGRTNVFGVYATIEPVCRAEGAIEKHPVVTKRASR